MRKKRAVEMRRLSVEEYKKAEKTPVTVVLDNVRSMYNVGSVFRTCDAFRVEGVCLCGITSTPEKENFTAIHKTAIGAEMSVDWTYFESAAACAVFLKKKGYTVLSVEQAEGSVTLSKFNFDFGKHYALVFGNEVKGVDRRVIDLSEECIEIPQRGTKLSMNVAVTAGIVLYAFSEYYNSGENSSFPTPQTGQTQ